MDKGIIITDGSKLGEKNGVNNEISESRAEENADSGLDGSKDPDGDEVFEEAVAETPRVNSENREMKNDETVDTVVTSENSNVNSDLGNEVEMFEEAIGVSGAFQNADKESEAKADFLMNESSDDNQIAAEKLVMDERNRLMDSTAVENGVGDTDSVASGKTENLNDMDDFDGKLGKSPENPEKDASDPAEFADAVITEENITEMSETQDVSELKGVDVGSEKPDTKEAQIHEISEIRDANEVKGGNTGMEEPVNCASDHMNLAETLTHEDPILSDSDALKEQSHKTSSETQDGNVIKRIETEPLPESKSSEGVLHHDEPNVVAIVREEVGNSLISGAQLNDGENTELKKLESHSEEAYNQDIAGEEHGSLPASDASVAVQVNESSRFSNDFLAVVEESTKNLEVVSSPLVKDSMAESVEQPCFSSSELVAENSGDSEPRLVNANEEVSEVVVNEPKKEGLKDEKEEQVASELIKPVAANSSSPAHPAIREHVSPQLEPTQNILGNREQVIRPVTNIAPSNVNSATPSRPAGLGRAAPLLEPTSRVVQQPRVNGAVSRVQDQLIEDPTNGEAEEYDETREKLQMIRVKFLRLAHRLGQTPHNVVVAQVLYRLGLAEQLRGRSGGRVAAFSFDRASAMAEQLEAAGQEPLDFTCTIMVLGKTGVGKSATINSIFDEVKFGTDAFQLGTKKVQDIVGTVQGIKVRVIDTPGLLPSWSDQRQNEKVLRSVKRFINKTTPDIVLYLDRLDMQSRDFGDMPLLRTITEIFGPSIWFNAIVVLTHAASAPPEGPNGTATSYDMFVTQRSHVVQQAIRQAAGDMRLMNPVSLVENHLACRTNRAGQRVLPNGQVWKPHLLLLSFASKILAEANTLLKLQDSSPGKPFISRARSPPLPFLLSSLLQSRPQVKLPSEQFGDEDDALDEDLDECSDSEDESEYDELPPFKPLTKAQLAKLTKAQRKAYYDELEYREKLFMKKQLKEEKKRLKMMKKMQEAAKDLSPDLGENAEEETNGSASVPVPMQDLALPASFDSDNPTHRYRYLDSSNPWLVRPVLEPNGWDHDIGYEGINVERLFVVKDKVPISFSGHVSKDKKDANLQMEIASSVKHGNGKATSVGFDMQSVGKDIAYTLRSETRFSNHRINKAIAGLSATLLGDVLTGGMKLEDKLIVGKRGQMVVSGGAIFGRGDVAYGGSLEATLRDKDHPLGRFLSTLGLSVMDWHGDLAIGCNSQTQIPIGRHTNFIGRVNINNRGSGQVSIRINSTEHLQIALISLIPLAKKLLGYSQPMQYA
ncbi:translocase of chloroplast 120, chloroplastic [Olea europaea var. sylvestris]|uniref:translocase of chloroplast 120, chloroplastic n=1 Tax=Olea europaea var. sylvestris TaxID=158386 RepID=UPI000C1D597B|nr:translocase of chloroplast 120, chloroplastic [Olea europaea var. sylvestris]